MSWGKGGKLTGVGVNIPDRLGMRSGYLGKRGPRRAEIESLSFPGQQIEMVVEGDDLPLEELNGLKDRCSHISHHRSMYFILNADRSVHNKNYRS